MVRRSPTGLPVRKLQPISATHSWDRARAIMRNMKSAEYPGTPSRSASSTSHPRRRTSRLHELICTRRRHRLFTGACRQHQQPHCSYALIPYSLLVLAFEMGIPWTGGSFSPSATTWFGSGPTSVRPGELRKGGSSSRESEGSGRRYVQGVCAAVSSSRGRDCRSLATLASRMAGSNTPRWMELDCVLAKRFLGGLEHVLRDVVG